jgi:uncharacterized low-complexity protein
MREPFDWFKSSVMWNETDTPLAYLISFRSYGTWLHGDQRGSIDRFHNRYRSPYIKPNQKWQAYNEQQLRAAPLLLEAQQRKAVERAIRETCDLREWWLQAVNIRTNHVHTVVSAHKKPGLILNAFKATLRGTCGKMACGRMSSVPGPIKAASGNCGMNKASPGRLTTC